MAWSLFKKKPEDKLVQPQAGTKPASSGEEPEKKSQQNVPTQKKDPGKDAGQLLGKNVQKPSVEKELTPGPKEGKAGKKGEQKKISIIRLVDALLAQSFKMGASDIHIDPEEKKIRVRVRIDGVMTDKFTFPKSIHQEIITRIKVMGGLRTDEHQAAQDGRLRTRVGEEFIDVRVSIAPTYFGENCVMRILSAGDKAFTLETLGFSEENLKKMQRAIEKPYGMILATGPTGSGKTTTLYSMLQKLNTPQVSIITIEDPIEYSLPGIEQVQVNERTGLVFSQGLRFILRQDPDVIMVGEIRDDETGKIAVNAAMTGHLLLSTLHTNDATTTIPRLIEMNVEPFLIASTLNVALGQRLLRKLCDKCKQKKKLTAAELERLKFVIPEKLLLKNKQADFYEAKGCGDCGSTGYKGRLGIHEVLEITSDIRELIMAKASGDVIRKKAQESGMTTMLEDGFEKSLKGLTTIHEVLRVFHE